MKRCTLLVLFLVVIQCAKAQQGTGPDSLHRDTLHLTEQLLIQQQQQKITDSLIKLRLQREIDLIPSDSRRKNELVRQIQRMIVNDSAREREKRNRIALLRKTAKGYPVRLLQDTLFLLYTSFGSFSAQERAKATTVRINKLYHDDFFDPDSLLAVQGENSYDIVYQNDRVILSVSDLDALYQNKEPQQLENEYLQLIKGNLQAKRQANSLLHILERIGMVVLIIMGVFLVIWGINRLFAAVSRKVFLKRETYFKGIRVKGYKLLTIEQHYAIFRRLLSAVRILIMVLAVYVSLLFLFSIFPRTKAYTYLLLNWITGPAKTVVKDVFGYLPKLFTILVIWLFVHYLIKLMRYLANGVKKGTLKINGFYSDWAQPTFNIVRFLMYAFLLILIFPYLPGSGSPAFQGVSVFLGILLSLGSSSAISNMVAGLVITYMRPFKVGDRVKIGDVTGDVIQKTMLVTRIRTIKNEEITVPNSTVLSNYTTNYTSYAQDKGLIIHTTVTIGYSVPWKKMHQALIDAALRTDLILQEPKPFVLQTELSDFYVSYQINAYTKHPLEQATIYSDLHQHIQDCCNEAGIEILSPHYTAMRDGNATSIPEDYLPDDYRAPAFHMSQRPDNS